MFRQTTSHETSELGEHRASDWERTEASGFTEDKEERSEEENERRRKEVEESVSWKGHSWWLTKAEYEEWRAHSRSQVPTEGQMSAWTAMGRDQDKRDAPQEGHEAGGPPIGDKFSAAQPNQEKRER